MRASGLATALRKQPDQPETRSRRDADPKPQTQARPTGRMFPMRQRWRAVLVVTVICAAGIAAQEVASVSETAKLQKMAARFAPTNIRADLSTLSAADRQARAKLVEASKIMDALFLRQVWAGNDTVLLDLSQSQTAEGRARLHYFLINKGPWSRLDHDEAFVPHVPAKPAGADFYPEGASKADL